MEDRRRLLFIGGVVVLVALTLWGVSSREGSDDVESVGPDASNGNEADGGPTVEANDASSDSSSPQGTLYGDGMSCEAYCGAMAETGGLANGLTEADCVAQLCERPSPAGEASGAEAVPPTMERPEGELPDDCRRQCQLLQQQGELRPGTTLDQCYDALCGS